MGGSVAAYYALHALGVSDTLALTAAAAVAGGRITRVAVRDRKLNAFAAVMLLVRGGTRSPPPRSASRSLSASWWVSR